MMRTHSFARAAIAGALVLTACRSGAVPQSASSSPVPSAADLLAVGTVVADSNEAKPVPPAPRVEYPDAERAARQEAAFTTVFVLDTAGRVVLPTAAFVEVPPPAFRRVVCNHYRAVRFEPVVRDGRRVPAVVVREWTFGVEGGRWWGRTFDATPLREALRQAGPAEALARLAAHTQRCR